MVRLTLRDLDIDIELDVHKDPLEDLNNEVNEFIGLLKSIDDSAINDVEKEFKDLNRTIDNATGEAKVLNR